MRERERESKKVHESELVLSVYYTLEEGRRDENTKAEALKHTEMTHSEGQRESHQERDTKKETC